MSKADRLKSIKAKLKVVGDCHEWTGGFRVKSYPAICWKGYTWRGNRLMWTLLKGEIPRGLHVCHSCDNPKCLNIKHLWLGTNKDNAVDMSRKGRAPKGRPCRTHCGRGHLMAGDNIRVSVTNGRSHRRCAECTRMRKRELRRKAKTEAEIK